MFFLEAFLSGIQYALLAVVLGAAGVAGFILPAGQPNELRRSLGVSAVLCLALFLLAASAALLVQGAKLEGGVFPSADILSRYLFRTQSGRIWLAREVYGALLLLTSLWLVRCRGSVKDFRMLCILLAPLLASRSLTSHAVGVKEGTAVVVTADAIHLIVTAVWAGGLPVLALCLHHGLKRLRLPLSWAARAVGSFSRAALVSVSALFLTGIYQGWTHLQTLSTLWLTPYGNVLLLKLGIFVCMLALGAVNFFFTRRTLQDRTNPESRPRIESQTLVRIGSESILGIAILFTTGFLTTLPPGVHSLHASSLREPQAAGRQATRKSWIARLARTAAPSLAKLEPAEGASVTILSPKPGQLFQSDQVPIRYEFTKGKRGHHLHAYVDGELMGMFSSPESVTLTGIPRGRRRLVLRVVAEDHVTELDASDSVDFEVK